MKCFEAVNQFTLQNLGLESCLTKNQNFCGHIYYFIVDQIRLGGGGHD